MAAYAKYFKNINMRIRESTEIKAYAYCMAKLSLILCTLWVMSKPQSLPDVAQTHTHLQ